MTSEENGDFFAEKAAVIISKYFRGCDIITELRVALGASVDDPMSTTFRHYITDEKIQRLVEHQTELDKWSTEMAKKIASDGGSKFATAYCAYRYITDHYSYDYDAASESFAKAEAQSGYYAMVNGKGICASLSRLFRCLVEAIPFNPDTGLVDWECDNPEYLTVINVSGNNHQWAAINFGDLIGMRYYECTNHELVRLESEAEQYYGFSKIDDPNFT